MKKQVFIPLVFFFFVGLGQIQAGRLLPIKNIAETKLSEVTSDLDAATFNFHISFLKESNLIKPIQMFRINGVTAACFENGDFQNGDIRLNSFASGIYISKVS